MPIAAGYDDAFAMYSSRGLSFKVSNVDGASPFFRPLTSADYKRPTGRGGPDEVDVPQGRPFQQPEALPDVKPWQAVPLTGDQMRNNPRLIPVEARPDVIVRWADAKQLLLSGLLENPEGMAGHAAVVDAHYGKGHVLLFANNPIWRGETIGSYALVFNALTHFGRLDERSKAAGRSSP
jgi:hypothetical protein